MCTVSVIPLRHPDRPDRIIGLRLVTNRDELRERPAATPPIWHELPAHATSGSSPHGAHFRAVYPIDPVGGGTWVAASTAGLVLCLLNANPVPQPVLPPEDDLLSRGLVIPQLIASRSAADAARAVARLELDRLAPFTLLAADLACPDGSQRVSTRLWQVRWDRRSLDQRELGAAPICIASSGLGDRLVLPRLPLFEQILNDADSPEPAADRQDRFHRHTWADRRPISVLMSRRDARTVSITTVELLAPTSSDSPSSSPTSRPATVTMTYEPIAEIERTSPGSPHRAATMTPTHNNTRVTLHSAIVTTASA